VYAMAEPLASFLARGYGVEGVALVARMLRLIAPAVLAFGLAGVLIGLLYALERFTLAAATGAVHNLGFIVAAVALQGRFGVVALPIGVTLGAAAQVLVLAPGVVRLAPRLRPRLRHPALGRALVLYVPVAAGLVASLVQGGVEPGLASVWGDAGLSWMRYATTLVQFPQGLIAAAIAVAILPRLAGIHARDEQALFSATLARGLRTVAALTIPAAVGLAVLAEPIGGVVFQRLAFGDVDRLAVTAALHLYLLGLPFAAIDWPMNYAFYARQNTVVPAAVGAFSVAVWFAVALRLPGFVAARAGFDNGYLGLVLADSVKQVAHAGVMLVLVYRATAGRGLQGLGRTVLAAAAAAAVMGAVVAGVDHALAARWAEGTLAWGLRAATGSAVGLGVYVALATALGVREVPWLLSEVRGRLALVGPGRRPI
ncbi:MAG: murein biosynthesis integral membrane protein MurJ, partial [Anaerolineae bacterium]